MTTQNRKNNWLLTNLEIHNPGTSAGLLPLVAQMDRINETDIGVLHCHVDFLALLIIRSGRGQHMIEGVPFGVSRGDVYLMGLGTEHRWVEFDDLVVDSFYFKPEIFDDQIWDVLRKSPTIFALLTELEHPKEHTGLRWLHLTPDQHIQIEEEVAEIRAEWISGVPQGVLLSRCLFLRLIVHLTRFYTRNLTDPTSAEAENHTTHHNAYREQTVAAAIRYIDRNFAEPISLEHVAASVFLSSARFREVFADVMGRSPSNYLRYIRIERAKALLCSTDDLITSIGSQTGLGAPAYFARVFRSETGLSPSEYRQQNRR